MKHLLVKGVISGFIGGLLATGPMTVWMMLANKKIPAKKPDPLPPEEITRNLTKAAKLEPHIDEAQQKQLSFFNHFIYGAILAIPISLLNRNQRANIALRRGVGLGLMSWGSNYLGLMPALKLYPPASREPRRMNFIMIIAHLFWACLASLLSNRIYQKMNPI